MAFEQSEPAQPEGAAVVQPAPDLAERVAVQPVQAMLGDIRPSAMPASLSTRRWRDTAGRLIENSAAR